MFNRPVDNVSYKGPPTLFVNLQKRFRLWYGVIGILYGAVKRTSQIGLLDQDIVHEKLAAHIDGNDRLVGLEVWNRPDPPGYSS